MLTKLKMAMIAGAVAIVINTFILFAADWIPLVTAHGGLLKLIKPAAGGFFQAFGIAAVWDKAGMPGPESTIFQLGFHIIVGLGMAIFYSFIVEPYLPYAAWVKGLIYALVVWLANACVVLPLIGEGFAGNRNLSMTGMGYYAIAHTIFFVLLATIYASLREGRLDQMRSQSG